MIYEYLCQKCDKIIEKKMTMVEDHPKTIKCPTCKEDATRYLGSVKIHIPESFQAKFINEDNYANPDNLNSKFKHSRPSGREKIYY